MLGPAALRVEMPPHSRPISHPDLMKPPVSPSRANIALQPHTQACGPSGRSQNDGLKELHNHKPQRWSWFHQANKRLSPFEAVFTEDTVQFHPDYAYGTAAAFGDYALTSSTITYWEVKVPHIYGTSVMFGIATLDTPIKLVNRFDNLVGLEGTSYGLSHKGILYHKGEERTYCEEFEENKMVVVGLYFSGPDKQLSYFVNGKHLGVAFVNINLDKPLYPIVSSTARKSTFILQNQYKLILDPTLRGICKRYIIRRVKFNKENVYRLNLPSQLADELKTDINHRTLQPPLHRSTPLSPSRLRKRPFHEVPDLTDEAYAAMLMSFLSSFQYDQLVQVAWAAGMEETCDR